MFVLPIPDIDGGTVFAGVIPIQTTPAITVVLNTRIRIDFASLTLQASTMYAELIAKVTVLSSFQRLNPKAINATGGRLFQSAPDLLCV
jgi:hypothetical protein